MKAVVVAIGDEMTSGQRIDTNSAWLSQRLEELGIPVLSHLTAADEIDACTDLFRFAADHAEVVMCTGGLGPTADDLTRDALAAATLRQLQLNEEVLDHIRHIFESRGRAMPDRNRLQAMFPTGSQVVPNPHGTAPGIDLTSNHNGRQVRWIALPGVPVEMREMWDATVGPSLAGMLGSGRAIVHKQIKCFGVGESACERMIPDLIVRGREPRVGITVHRATITLRITATGGSYDACLSAMQPTLDEIQHRLGDLVFGQDEDELQDAVVRLLQQRGESVAVCESGTLGVLAHWLCDADKRQGSSTFCGGIVALSRDAANILSSDDTPADPSSITATMEAAEAIATRTGATYGLALGAFPTDGRHEFPIALAINGAANDNVAVMRGFAGHPDILVERSTKQALDLLRRHLMSP
jgi:nicotinamide-nucleotide amidase